MSNPVNCKDASTCSTTEGCAEVSNNCVCAVGYGSEAGDASDCKPCEGDKYSGSPSKGQCSVCNGENQVAYKTGSGAGNDACACKAGYGLNDGKCAKCEGKQYSKGPSKSACSTCSGDGAIGLPASATSDGNTICGCDAGYSGANGTENDPGKVTCTACSGNNYTG